MGIWTVVSKNKKGMLSWILVCIVTVIGYLPWLPVAFSQIFKVTDSYWIPYPTSKAWVMFQLFDIGIPYVWNVYELLLLIIPVYSIICLIFKRKSEKKYDWWAFVSVICVWILWGIGVGYMILKDRPILVSRYLIAGVIVFAVGSSALAQKMPKIIVIISCVFAGLVGLSYFVQRYESIRNDRTSEMIEFCQNNINAEDEVYFWEDGYGYLSFCMNYYVGNVYELNDNHQDISESERVWFFKNERVADNENVQRIEKEMNYVGQYEFGSEKVWIYTK